ncbi:MAG: hypothetical protein KTR25_15315 [Myxococcales bacterium]|nr:hypothetical protein [Myxococcales bacterium]
MESPNEGGAWSGLRNRRGLTPAEMFTARPAEGCLLDQLREEEYAVWPGARYAVIR